MLNVVVVNNVYAKRYIFILMTKDSFTRKSDRFRIRLVHVFKKAKKFCSYELGQDNAKLASEIGCVNEP